MWKRIGGALICAPLFLCHGALAQGVKVIDARLGMTPEVLFEYHQAMLGVPGNPYNHTHIIILASAYKGFDPGVFQLPPNRRYQSATVRIQLMHGGTVVSSVRANGYDLSSPRGITALRARTRIRR